MRLSFSFRPIPALMLAVAGCLMAGCGDDTGDRPVAAASIYSGSYSGSFTTTNSQAGTLAISVNTAGQIEGSSTNTTLNQNAVVSGSIDNSGNVTSTFVYPSGTYTAAGFVTQTTTSHLVGTLTQRQGSAQDGAVTIDLTKQ